MSQNVSKSQDDDDDYLFIPPLYKVDSNIYIIKKNEPKRVRSNSNSNGGIDVLANATSDRQHRIMIVDDEQDIARLFAIGLEDNGFIVDVFTDPLSALSNYKPGHYDLLLLDIRMPSMNGFELYQKIKDIDDKAQVCFITAHEESLNDFRRLFPSLEEFDCFVR